MASVGTLQSSAAAEQFVCLLYHDVHPDQWLGYDRLGKSAVKYHISETAFHEHLRLIQRSGAQPFGLEAVRRCFGRRLGTPAKGARRGVVVCFDDGWEGAVRRAAPALQQAAMPALFFVTTGFLGRKFFATTRDLRQLDAALFTVGSHGATHRMLSSLSPALIKQELGDSKQQLEDVLGRRVTSLSIPGGAVDARVIAIACELGYTEVFTSTIGVNPTSSGRYDIARLGVTRATSLTTLRRWLSFHLEDEWWRKAVLDVPKRLLGMRTYSRLRRVLLGEVGADEHFFEP